MSSKSRDPSSSTSKQHARQSTPRSMMMRRNILNFNHLLTSRYGPSDNYCRYLHRFCLQTRLDGYSYCIRHIMHCDRTSPFKTCNFLHPQTGKRCSNAARRLDRRDLNFCSLHTRQFNLNRRKQSHVQVVRHLPESMRDCLKRKFDELEHYCPSNEHDHRRKQTQWELPEDKGATTSRSLKNKINESIAKLAIQNENDDDINSIQIGDALDLIDSDNENVESYMDDPLRHSGVYSAEEIAHTLRNKMLRLQTLYINLLNYYKNILKNKMRLYYQAKQDKSNQHKKNLESITHSLKEEEDMKIFKAMQKYHSLWGAEKVVKDTALEMRRLLVNEEGKKSDNQSRCIYKKDNQSCNQQCVPLSHYCKTHILYDTYQILYRPCAAGDPSCLNPVISYVHKNTCVEHTQIKYSKSDISNILKSPTKHESTSDNNQVINELVNESGLFQSIEEFNIDGVSTGNLEFNNLDQFDISGNDILS